MVWVTAALAGILICFLVFVRTPMRRAIALNLAAQRAGRRKDFRSAIAYCRASYQAADKVKEPDRSQAQAKTQILLATLLYRQGSMREAEKLFERGFARTREAGCYPEMKPAYVVWGDLCTDQGRDEEAEQYYNLALQGEKQIGNIGGLVFGYQRMGDCLLRQGKREPAEEALQLAMAAETSIVQPQGDSPVISWVLPDLHFCREEYEIAGTLYREKVEHWEKQAARPELIDLGRLQMRLAECHAQAGHRVEAMAMYSRAEHTFAQDWGAGHPKIEAARNARSALLAQTAEVSQ
jgi:tetratricopeptide (TPR) repeat protein